MFVSVLLIWLLIVGSPTEAITLLNSHSNNSEMSVTSLGKLWVMKERESDFTPDVRFQKQYVQAAYAADAYYVLVDGNKVIRMPLGSGLNAEYLVYSGLEKKKVENFEGFCVLTADNDIYCRDDYHLSFSKRDVSSFGTHKIVSFSSGVNHACIALDSGKVFCLGRNYAGQLGFGTSPLKYFLEEEEELRPFRKYFLFSSSLPIPHFTEEVSLGDKIITFHKVVVSDNTSCAISNERPSGLYCWGKLDSLSSVEGEERKSNLERAFTIQPKKIQLPLDGAGIVDVALNGHKVCITNEKGKGYCKLKLIDSASWTEYQMTEVKFPLKQTRLSESNHWFVVDADDRVFGSLELKMKPIKLQYKSFQ